MTLNNIGNHHINKTTHEEIYKELLLGYEDSGHNLYFIVVLLKSYTYNQHYPTVTIECVVSDGQIHTYSNGVKVYKDTFIDQWRDPVINPPRQFTTKHGFICKEVIAQTMIRNSTQVRYEWETNVTPDNLLEILYEAKKDK